MSFSLGQLGGVTDPVTWQDNGPDQVSLSGKLNLGSGTSAMVARQQLLGYLGNPDEKYIPIVSTVDTARTGFYRITSMQVDTTPENVSGMLPFAAKVEKLPGYSYPLIEMLLSGAARAGSVGSPTPWHAVPSTWNGYDMGGAALHGLWVRGGATHGSGKDIWMMTDAAYYGPLLATQAGCAPANFYDCAVQFTSAGNLVVGRQFPSDPTSWVLANQMLELSQDTSGSNLLKIRMHDGTAWSASTSFKLTSDAGTTFWGGTTGVRSVTLLRNGPERVAIRLALPMNPAYATGAATVDLTLRRGSRYIEGSVKSNFSGKWGLQYSANQTTTAVDGTGGAHRMTGTVSDNHGGAGHRIILGCGQAVTYDDATTGRCALTANGTQFDFLLGSDIQAGSAVAPDRATDIRDQYYAAVTETQWVVAQ